MAARKKVSSTPTIIKMPDSWSFSRWSTYENCPRKAKLQYIDGFRDEGSDATNRGTDVHALAESWLKAKKPGPLAPIFNHFKVEFETLHRLKAAAEIQLGFRRDWTGCEFDDPHYWWHGAIDAIAVPDLHSAWIVDFKTGKVREQHALQLELYALAVFLFEPNIETIRCEDWYIDQHRTMGNNYHRRQVPGLIQIWERRTTPMFADRDFVPCPNFLCGWCPFRKELGSGLCEYGSGDGKASGRR